MNSRPFHLTVATTPQFGPDDEYTLGEELALVKAALLYGDGVRLCSPGTSMVMQLQGNRDAETPEERRDHIANYLTTRVLTDPNGDVGRLFPKLQMFLRSENDPAKRERVVRSTVRQHTITDRLSDEQWEQMGEEQWAMARDAGADGIVTAIDAGLLELHEFAGDPDFGWAAAGPERQIAKTKEFVDLVAGAVVDRTTYPVFDADAARIARWAVEQGVVSPSKAQIRRGQHAGLAADLLGRLPTFESASVDEVIAVRRELEGPLVRFRGAVSGFAASISSEPWGEDFELEAQETFVRQVEPSVQEIRETVEANASLASLAAKVGFSPFAYAEQGMRAFQRATRQGLEATEQGLKVVEEATERTEDVLRQTEQVTREAELRTAVFSALGTTDYDALTVEEVSRRIDGLPTEQLEKVREFEKTHKNRETLVGQIDRKIRANS